MQPFRPPAPGGSWPSADQTLLLQAALGEGDAARLAYRAWRARIDLDRLDYGSARLLPLLALNLGRLGLDGDVPPAFRDRLDRTAARNAQLVEAARRVTAVLRKAGIDTLALKGLALVITGQVPAGARPMDDIDVLVPDTRALDARDALVADGWRATDRLGADLIGVHHATEFTRAPDVRLDLHWHVFAENCEPGADLDLWQAAEPAAAGDERTLVLAPADFVLHVATHGLRWSRVPPVRWAADAIVAIRSAGPRMDWRRLGDQAVRRSLVLPALDALGFLRDALDVAVPGDVIDHLARVEVPRRLVAEHRIRMQRRTWFRQARYHWLKHRRLSNGAAVADLTRFPDYLRRRWGLESYADVARHILTKRLPR